MTPGAARIKVFRIDLELPLRPLVVEEGYDDVLLVVTHNRSVIGHVSLPPASPLPVDVQWKAIVDRLEANLWRSAARAIVDRDTRGSPRRPNEDASPDVSVVVCTRERPDQLRVCLDSLDALATRPAEVVVVDNSESDERTRRLCSEYSVRYVHEPIPGQARARNRGILQARGDLIAFTDDDCVVDPHWLDGLGHVFADPLVMAVTGYIGPLELETPSQCLFEVCRPFPRRFAKTVFDGCVIAPAIAAGDAGAGANVVFRRDLFAELGAFAEHLGPGTPARAADDTDVFYRILASGYRIVFDPARIVWHRHRRDAAGLTDVLYGSAVSSSAYAARCLGRHGETDVWRIWAFFARRALRDLAKSVTGRNSEIPAKVALVEAVGTIVGPWQLVRSRLARRAISPLPRPAAATSNARVDVAEDAAPVSVVIPSHNRREALSRTLEALGKQTYPVDRFEVIVVLDGSRDGSAELVRELDSPADFRTLEQDRRGAGASRNRGVEAARHPIIAFLDDDVIPDPAWLAAHASMHRDRFENRVVLGYYPPVFEGSSLVAMNHRAWWEDHFRRKLAPGHRWTYIDFVAGNVSLSRRLFEKVGRFDEDFDFYGAEDWELGLRLLEGGAVFAYEPAAKGLHGMDLTLPVILWKARHRGRTDVLFVSKHPEVKDDLPLARVAAKLEPARSPLSFAYRHRRTASRLAAATLPAARLLDDLRWRRASRALTGRLLGYSYVLGLADVFDSPEDLLEFLDYGSDPRSRPVVDVPLDAGPSFTIPPGSRAVLSLSVRDMLIAQAPAAYDGGQWDWEQTVDLLVDQASRELQGAAQLDELLRGGAALVEGRPSRPTRF